MNHPQIVTLLMVTLAQAIAVGRGVKDVKIGFRPELDVEKAGDQEFCVVNVQASDRWLEKHEVYALVAGNRVAIPAVFRSTRDGHNSNRLEASQTEVTINTIPIEVVVKPNDKLEVVGVAFETFDDVVGDSDRALVVRFELRPISEIKNYRPPEPTKIRMGMSSFNKYKPAKPFPGLKQLLAKALPMPDGAKSNPESTQSTAENK